MEEEVSMGELTASEKNNRLGPAALAPKKADKENHDLLDSKTAEPRKKPAFEKQEDFFLLDSIFFFPFFLLLFPSSIFLGVWSYSLFFFFPPLTFSLIFLFSFILLCFFLFHFFLFF